MRVALGWELAVCGSGVVSASDHRLFGNRTSQAPAPTGDAGGVTAPALPTPLPPAAANGEACNGPADAKADLSLPMQQEKPATETMAEVALTLDADEVRRWGVVEGGSLPFLFLFL
jgi:hypothetical protein